MFQRNFAAINNKSLLFENLVKIVYNEGGYRDICSDLPFNLKFNIKIYSLLIGNDFLDMQMLEL